MKELIESLVKELKVDDKQATGGAAILLKAAKDKLGADEFAKLLGKAKGVDQLVAKAPESGGIGKLFGGFASALGGGNAAIIANILSGFRTLGLSQEHAQKFVPVMLSYLRGKIGADNADKLEKTLRA